MSEKISLTDLLNERSEAESKPADVVEETTVVEEPKEEKKNVSKYLEMMSYDQSKAEALDVTELPGDNRTATEKARDEIMDQLDDGLERALKRRFEPALKEIHEMREEYEMRLAAGEKNPQVISRYNNAAELDVSVSDKDIPAFKSEEEDLLDYPETSRVSDVDLIEEEFEKMNNLDEGDIRMAEVQEPVVKKVVIPDTHVNEEEFIDPIEEAKAAWAERTPQEIVSDIVKETDEELEEEIAMDVEIDEMAEDLGLEEELSEEERERKRAEDQRVAEEFAKSLKSKLKVRNSIKPDISKFKIRNRPASLSKALKGLNNTSYSQWGLFATGIPISLSPLSAIELDEINPADRNKNYNSVATIRGIYNTIYRHIPKNARNMEMETWLKHINFLDVDHLYFAIYKACFEKANIIPYHCDKCDNFFSEEKKILDMVKFETDKDKEYYEKIIRMDPTMPSAIEEEVYVASDKFAFGIVTPTIYNSQFEERFLEQDFREKYAGIINLCHCISTVYEIDQEAEELIPVRFKFDEEDIIKTYKFKILSIYQILNKLSAIEFKEMQDYIETYLTEKSNRAKISYQLPGATCPKCGNKIEAEPSSAATLVFTRHQLIRMLT